MFKVIGGIITGLTGIAVGLGGLVLAGYVLFYKIWYLGILTILSAFKTGTFDPATMAWTIVTLIFGTTIAAIIVWVCAIVGSALLTFGIAIADD